MRPAIGRATGSARPTADALNAEVAKHAPATDAAEGQTQRATGSAVCGTWLWTRVAASNASLKDAAATTSGESSKAAAADEQGAGRQGSEAPGASTSRADAKEATADSERSRWCSNQGAGAPAEEGAAAWTRQRARAAERLVLPMPRAPGTIRAFNPDARVVRLVRWQHRLLAERAPGATQNASPVAATTRRQREQGHAQSRALADAT